MFRWGSTQYPAPEDEPWGFAAESLWHFIVGEGAYWPINSKRNARTHEPGNRYDTLMASIVTPESLDRFQGRLCPLADHIFAVYMDLKHIPMSEAGAAYVQRLNGWPVDLVYLGLVSFVLRAFATFVSFIVVSTMMIVDVFMQGLIKIQLNVVLPRIVLPAGNNAGRCTSDVWKRVLLTTFNKWEKSWYSILLVESCGNNCIMVDRKLRPQDCQQLFQAEHAEEVPYGMFKGPIKTLHLRRQEMIMEHITTSKHPVVTIEHKKIVIYVMGGM